MLRIYASELRALLHETSEYPQIETGGSLLGLWSVNGNPTVFLATRPGPGSQRSATHFVQDAAFHNQVERRLLESDGIQSLGLWHSHHSLGLHELSGGDRRRTQDAARRSRRARSCDLLTYFSGSSTQAGGEISVKPYVYTDAAAGVLAPTQLVVLDGMSPIRAAMLRAGGDAHLSPALRGAPDTWAGPWRSADSTAALAAQEEDQPVQERHRRSLFGRRPKEATVETSAGAPAGAPAANSVEWEELLERHVAPLLGGVDQAGLECEAEPIAEGRALQVLLRTKTRTATRVLYVAWDGRQAVVFRDTGAWANRTESVEYVRENEAIALPRALDGAIRGLTTAR
ncbi:hypothetical protein [Micromonospora sp. NPDC005203]|uniref:hypothetical protein n=1 Tax=Micromonospora sp. NPDC005203 TaxID=3364226 RepID=UPI0036956213